MLNPFELEMQMLEQVKETEKKQAAPGFPVCRLWTGWLASPPSARYSLDPGASDEDAY